VACGADGADGVGAVTVGRDVPVELRVVVLADRCSEPDDDRCSEPDECFPERVDVSSAADRVAIPIPIDAPRARRYRGRRALPGAFCCAGGESCLDGASASCGEPV